MTSNSQKRIIIAGASGLVGSALAPFLRSAGYDVKKLTRKNQSLSDDERSWDPSRGILSLDALKDVDAVINLAGSNIAGQCWSEAVKEEILQSRVQSTALLSKTMASLPAGPKILINASAVGFYGDRGNEPQTESSPAGEGFLARVCREWEAATAEAEKAGIRVVHLRIGTVLAKEGGALSKMLIPFKLGIGGVIGSGEQYMSWIALDDLMNIILMSLQTDAFRGPLNAVAPEPVSNAEFTKALGSVLHRPTFLPMPTWMARAAFGEMANELILSGTKALPEKLLKSGYRFLYPELQGALEHTLS